jgi:hypothetical protein
MLPPHTWSAHVRWLERGGFANLESDQAKAAAEGHTAAPMARSLGNTINGTAMVAMSRL